MPIKKDYYENGNVWRWESVDEHGNWTSGSYGRNYYDGTPQYEATRAAVKTNEHGYKDFHPVGLYKCYWPNGKLRATITHPPIIPNSSDNIVKIKSVCFSGKKLR